MKRNLSPLAAFTLAEVIIASAVSSVIFASLLAGTVALRRSFEAADYHVRAQNDQIRAIDYIGRDLRSASKITILDQGTRANLELPQESNTSLTVHLDLPVLGTVTPGSAATLPPKKISYYREGSRFIREVNGTKTELADTVGTFQISRVGSLAKTTLTFTPRFSRSPLAAAQKATTLTSSVHLRNTPP